MVFKKTGWPWPLHSVCHQLPTGRPIAERLQTSFEAGFDSLLLPLWNDEYFHQRHSSGAALRLDDSTVPSEQHFDAREHTRNIMLELNQPLIEQCTDEMWRSYLQFVLGYAAYLGVYTVAAELPRNNRKAFAEVMNRFCESGKLGNVRLILRVRFEASQLGNSQWQWYSELRDLLTSKLAVDLMLVVGADLPAQNELRRWYSEHPDYLSLSPVCFTTNPKGHPVLSGRHADILKQLLWRRATVCIQQLGEENNLPSLLKFVHFVFEQLRQPSIGETDALRYADILQEPLQPYRDNLESGTYGVFEQDNAKYDEYEMALQRALLKFPQQQKIIVFYIGSGRGQLLFSCFNAAKKTSRKVFVYAVEKNPYPVQSLKRRIAKNKWQQSVEVIENDVRNWQPPAPADIFLSELLGGFGDNELSPECLSWAERHLQSHTVCIPERYSAWCAPVACGWLHRKLQPDEKEKYFVVRLNSAYVPSEVQRLWTFEHPLKPDENFERHSILTFTIEQPTAIHGFAGYFDCDLYENCRLSTNPDSHTPDMHSWYPVWFAVDEPLSCRRDDQVVIRVWRRRMVDRVWYEWQMELHSKLHEQTLVSKVHNKEGHAISILL